MQLIKIGLASFFILISCYVDNALCQIAPLPTPKMYPGRDYSQDLIPILNCKQYEQGVRTCTAYVYPDEGEALCDQQECISSNFTSQEGCGQAKAKAAACVKIKISNSCDEDGGEIYGSYQFPWTIFGSTEDYWCTWNTGNNNCNSRHRADVTGQGAACCCKSRIKARPTVPASYN